MLFLKVRVLLFFCFVRKACIPFTPSRKDLLQTPECIHLAHQECERFRLGHDDYGVTVISFVEAKRYSNIQGVAMCP